MNIGIALVTHNRFDRFKQCFESIVKNCRDLEHIIVIDDCSTKDADKYKAYLSGIPFKHIQCIRTPTNVGVGVAKNIGMKKLIDLGCEYIFTIEDDIIIKNPDVFKAYITASVNTGFEYFNFAHHGPANVGQGYTREFNKFSVALFPNCVGAFTLYTRGLIEQIGYHDEEFFNAWEHIDYAYRASLRGLTTPFYHFIDIEDSFDYLEEQPGSLEDSSIRPKSDWLSNVKKGYEYFTRKHGVAIFDIPK